MKLHNWQLEAAAPYITQDLCFIGELRGFAVREATYDEKDKDGKKIGETKKSIRQLVVEVQPEEGMPIPKLVEITPPRGEETVEFHGQKGQLVVVVVSALKEDKYAKQVVVKAKGVYPLPSSEPAKSYQLGGDKPAAVPSAPSSTAGSRKGGAEA